MDQVLFLRNRDNLNRILSENSEIGIILPERHTVDVVAAGLALLLSLNASGKNVQIVSKGIPLVEYSNLFGIDKLKKVFDGKVRKLTISVPYVEGEIEKVSYDKDEEKRRLLVNFIAEENGITFSESEVEYIKKGTVPSVVICLGIINPNQLDGIVDVKLGATKFIVINNNPEKDMHGEVSYQEGIFSSISEIIGKIIALHGFVIDQDIAQNLLDGIISSTNNFTHDRTSSTAFEVTGVMMRSGAKRRRDIGRQNMQKSAGLENLVKFDNRNDTRNDARSDNRRDESNRDKQKESVFTHQPAQPFEDVEEAPPQAAAADVQPVEQKEEKKEKIPSDWFVPKIYKGNKSN